MAASGVFVYAVFVNCWLKRCPEMSGEAKTHVDKHVPKKVGLQVLCGPKNWQTFALVMCF